MDPNEALKRARGALSRYRDEYPDGQDDLADAFEALDVWLSKGGFLPVAWVTGDRISIGEFAEAVQLLRRDPTLTIRQAIVLVRGVGDRLDGIKGSP